MPEFRRVGHNDLIAQAVNDALFQLLRIEDFDFGLDHLVDRGNGAARRVTGRRHIDIVFVELHQQAGIGGIGRRHGRGDGEYTGKQHEEDGNHEHDFTLQQGDNVARLKRGLPALASCHSGGHRRLLGAPLVTRAGHRHDGVVAIVLHTHPTRLH